MSDLVTALSNVPFALQVHNVEKNKQQRGASLPIPGTDCDSNSNVPLSPLWQRQPRDDCTTTNDWDYHDRPNITQLPDLSQAWDNAGTAFNIRGTTGATLIWQPSETPNLEHRKFSSNSSTRAPNKRAAEPADLQQPILTKKKKQKTEGTTAQTTQTVEPSSRGTIAQAKEIGRPSSIGTFTRNAPLQPHLGPTQLSAKSPVQVPIPFEVWEHILSWTPLPFLRSVKDLSPTFRGILASNTPWRKSRRRTFSAEHPDPPPGMHEREYAELILGSGCQNESCRRTVARTWWAFRRRWCGECLSGKIVHVKGCGSILRRNPKVLNYIPCAKFNEHDIYQGVINYKTNRSPGAFFSRADIAKILEQCSQATNEFGSTMETENSRLTLRDTRGKPKGKPNTALQAWIDNKVDFAGRLIQQLSDIEKWWDEYQGKDSERAKLKERKSNFFAKKVQLMDPLLDLKDIKKMSCFSRALTSKTEPSEKSWKALKDRIQTELNDEVKRRASSNSNPEDEQRMAAVAESRKAVRTKLLILADQVIANLGDFPQTLSHRLLAGDLVRIVLNRVHKLHNEAQTTRGFHLLIDDARFVYNHKIEPLIAAQDNLDTRQSMSQLGCPGCRHNRPQDKMQGNFEQLMSHIFEKHGADEERFQEVGEATDGVTTGDMCNKPSLPWIQYRWQSAIPILAAEVVVRRGNVTQTVTPIPYLNAMSPRLAPEFRDLPSAFDGRVASTKIGPNAKDFVGNIIFAASRFHEYNVPDIFKTKIALEYALRKNIRVEDEPPGEDKLEQLQDALFAKGICGLFEDLRCRQCCINHGDRLGYFVRSGKPFEELKQHYYSKHKRLDWARNMVHLPSGEDLAACFSLPSQRKAHMVFKTLFPIMHKTKIDPRLQGKTHEGFAGPGLTPNEPAADEIRLR